MNLSESMFLHAFGVQIESLNRFLYATCTRILVTDYNCLVF